MSTGVGPADGAAEPYSLSRPAAGVGPGDPDALAKVSPARATGAHVSLIGRPTGEGLRRDPSTADTADGPASGSQGVPVVKPALGPPAHCIGVRSGSRPRPSPGTFLSHGSRTLSGGLGTSRMPISSP